MNVMDVELAILAHHSHHLIINYIFENVCIGMLNYESHCYILLYTVSERSRSTAVVSILSVGKELFGVIIESVCVYEFVNVEYVCVVFSHCGLESWSVFLWRAVAELSEWC